MHTRAMRVLRGSAAAVFATFTAALSHVFAGGAAPSLFGIAVSLVIAIALCTLLAGRTVSLLRLSIAMLASQGMYHFLFSSMLAPTAIAQHDMAAMAFTFSPDSVSAGSVMSLSHAAAAVITVVMFRYAEGAFWGLLTTARLFFSRLVGAVAISTATVVEFRVAPSTTPVVRFISRVLSTMRYRGPPAALSAA